MSPDNFLSRRRSDAARPSRALASIAAALCVLLLAAAADAGEPAPLRFGAGAKGGGFALLGEDLARAAEAARPPLRLEVAHTKGSCDNIRGLLRGELDVALVQYDVAAEAYNAGHSDVGLSDEGAPATGGWMCALTAEDARRADLQLISALSDGAVHMLVRRPVRLDSFDAIGDRPIYLGKRGSGSYETAKVLVGAAGYTVDDLNLFAGSSDDALTALREQRLLMMLRTTERGDPDIAAVVASGLATVNPLPEDVLDRLIDGYPYYRICPIEPRTYHGLDFAVPTVCVTTVLLSARPRDPALALAHQQRVDAAVPALLDGLRAIAHDPAHKLELRARGFAESEPIPLHPLAAARETEARWRGGLKVALVLALALLAGLLLRRWLRRRGLLRRFGVGIEGHLSNPLVPFAGFALIVGISTFIVWLIEHDSNARLRTLNDSFWEMNTLATGNFSTETIKSSTARFVGAAATIFGLGLLAWFTAALTNIFAQDQTRLFQRLRGHLVVLNFREDMLPLIRLLRSPGPAQHRPIHVMVSESLPRRVRLQLARVKSLTIHQENPEVPENLVGLRLSRAARVIILEGGATREAEIFHPLRIARAVHHACALAARRDHGVLATTNRPAIAGDRLEPSAIALPRTLVETSDDAAGALFDPFRAWLTPLNARDLAHTWLARAATDPHFADFFTSVVSFRDDNAEIYTVDPPTWLLGKTWRLVRRTLYALEAPHGIIPLGITRPAAAGPESLLLNPDLALVLRPGDRLIALSEDASELTRALRASRRVAEAQEAALQNPTASTSLGRLRA